MIKKSYFIDIKSNIDTRGILSSVIEHFSKEDAPQFIKECHRVLKTNGVLRIAYPDLEQLVYQYITLLKEVRNGNCHRSDDYDWIMLELLDQSVRNYSGGEMFKYFVRESIPNEPFVVYRCGTEAKKLVESGKQVYLGQMKMGGGIKNGKTNYGSSGKLLFNSPFWRSLSRI
ncbi:hypothetical protein FACS1894137_07000 [Spirochaetia bacterium]|nr:hypothetical protein FACS1894137_07000 [Spirochaetia bacterium]